MDTPILRAMNRLNEIKSRLAAATRGNWVYESKRDTHDFCIYVKGAKASVYGDIDFEDGVVGSSEWIWIKDADGEFIAHSKADIEWLINEIERLQLIER